MHWPFIRNLPREFHIDFVRLAPAAAVLSALLIVGSIGSFVVQGLNFGIDFRGGTLLEVQAKGVAPLAELRRALPAAGAHDAQVQAFGSPDSAMLRFRTEHENVQEAQAVKEHLAARFPDMQFKRMEVVGPKVSGELMTSGFMALGIALLLIVPDASMLGYLRGPRLGAIVYNIAHDMATGTAIAGVGVAIGSVPIAAAGAILVAHSGMDRTMGYGLKLPSSFRDTHLGRIGHSR